MSQASNIKSSDAGEVLVQVMEVRSMLPKSGFDETQVRPVLDLDRIQIQGRTEAGNSAKESSGFIKYCTSWTPVRPKLQAMPAAACLQERVRRS